MGDIIKTLEKILPPMTGRGNGQSRLYPPGLEALVKLHIVEPTPEDLEAQEAAAKADQAAKEKKSQQSEYIAIELAALLSSIQSINFQPRPQFRSLT